MTRDERDKLRRLQDRWLALPRIRRVIERYGEDVAIDGTGTPTIREVRHVLLPSWKAFFESGEEGRDF